MRVRGSFPTFPVLSLTFCSPGPGRAQGLVFTLILSVRSDVTLFETKTLKTEKKNSKALYKKYQELARTGPCAFHQAARASIGEVTWGRIGARPLVSV